MSGVFPSPWKIRGGELSFEKNGKRRVLVMGILNVTPDSFSDGGRHSDPSAAVEHALLMISQGADIIDIGAQSTRPGFSAISPQEEWSRLEPVLSRLMPVIGGTAVSVDTFYPEVARRALDAGVHIVNDVTGLASPEMRTLVAEYECGAVLMRCGELFFGEPVEETQDFFDTRLAQCERDGIDPHCVVLDCGIGFGTTRAQDITLLRETGRCRVGGLPMLAAASRKRVIAEYYSGDVPPEQRDEGTHKAHLEAVFAGADIIRVHDVTGAVKSLAML